MTFESAFKVSEFHSTTSSVSAVNFGRSLPSAIYEDGLITTLTEVAPIDLDTLTMLGFPNGSIPIISTAFGSVFYLFGGAVWFFQSDEAAHVEACSVPSIFLDDILSDDDVLDDILLRTRFDQCRELIGPLRYGECYALELAEQLGGSPETNLYRKVRLPVHLAFISQC